MVIYHGREKQLTWSRTSILSDGFNWFQKSFPNMDDHKNTKTLKTPPRHWLLNHHETTTGTVVANPTAHGPVVYFQADQQWGHVGSAQLSHLTRPKMEKTGAFRMFEWSWKDEFNQLWQTELSIPIASMYGIFSYIYHKNQPNVGKYTIHGSYGILSILPKTIPGIKMQVRYNHATSRRTKKIYKITIQKKTDWIILMKYLLLMEEIWLITEPPGMYIYSIYINLVNNRINYVSTSGHRISFIVSACCRPWLSDAPSSMSQWQCCSVLSEPFDLGKSGCNMMGPHHLQLPIYKAIYRGPIPPWYLLMVQKSGKLTSWSLVYPTIYIIHAKFYIYIPDGCLGFLPSTVLHQVIIWPPWFVSNKTRRMFNKKQG